MAMSELLISPPSGTLDMRRIDNWMDGMRRLATGLAGLAIAGCSLLQPQPEPPPIPDPVEPEAEIVILPPLPAPEPAPQPKKTPPIAPPVQLPTLAIVLTSGVPAYAEVARELSQRFEKHKIYNLAEDDRPPVSILRSINDSDSGVVVAIGLRAAMSSLAMAVSPVVFSQVFNYQDLLTENSRGVSAVPPLDAQIAAWKEINPSISRIGAIVGKGHEALIAEARDAAEKHDVELLMHVASSDQETLFIFKRMIRNIDGFWLFPDNRVLSPRALQQIIAGANQQRVPVLVPTESMLAMGAEVSISSVAADVAETITGVVRQIEAGDIENIPPISSLSEIQVVTDDAAQVVVR